jgi:two-component system, OmpR family, sensor histidine kinase MtrB
VTRTVASGTAMPHAELASPAVVADESAAPISPQRWWLRAVHALAGVASRVARMAARLWTTSLQVRVAASTLVVTGAVVVAVGVFLLDGITSGILHAKQTAAIAQADLGRATAAQILDQPESGDTGGIEDAIDRATTELSVNGSSAGLFSVIIESPSARVNQTLASDAAISTQMRLTVHRGNLVVQYAPIRVSGSADLVSGLIVGAPIAAPAGIFELYYLFPLSAEQDTIALVQRTVLLAGLGLVLLVVIIAVIVTRQVVRPVRMAATTAARLAGGDLSQRIRLRGSDDIARLAESFNGMAESLQRQIRRLEELSRLQRRFTSDVSHSLRTPLTTIRMAAELLHASRSDFAPELARAAELLFAELDRFESLLADLLEISRHDAGVAYLEADTVDVRSVVDAAVDASRTLAERHGSEIVTTMPEELVEASIDPRRVERILRNLLGNALDHGEGRPVEVSVAADDCAVAVTVRDYGVGLKPGEAGLVFNRFWRGDPSRSRLTGGTGLGLAISLEDARLHGGWLQAWGERGQGAVFRLTLPCRSGESVTSSPLPLEPAEAELGGTR